MLNRYALFVFLATLLPACDTGGLLVVEPIDAAPDVEALPTCGAADPCHIYSTADGGCAVVGDSDGARCSDDTFCVGSTCATIHCSDVAIDCYFYTCAATVCAAGRCVTTLDPAGTACADGHCDGKGVCK